jgi:lycopene beta-cyclase
LLLDENSKKTNDRTWCFWQTQKGTGNAISKKWDSALLQMLILNAI